MEPVDANELLSLQTEGANLFDKTATITRITTDVQDSVGGRTQGTSTFTVACRLLHNSKRVERTREIPQDRAAVLSHWSLLVPVGTGLLEKDKVTIGALTFTIIRSTYEQSLPIFESATLNLIE